MRKFFIKADLTADENEEGRISGYASVYGNIDSYSEVIDKGAFSEILSRYSLRKCTSCKILYRKT